MNRLIKSELYRIRHSNGIFRWIIAVCLLTVIIPMLSDLNFYKKTMMENWKLFSGAGIIFIPVLISIIICLSIGVSYQNKTSYYEIIEGHSEISIILSKLIVYVSLFTFGVMAVIGLYLGSMGAINGIGKVIDKFPLRIVLFIIIIIHVTVVSVLMSLLVRNIAAPVLGFLRFEFFEGILTAILPSILTTLMNANTDTVKKFTYFFVMGQLKNIASGKINMYFVFAIIISFVLECVLWFIPVYISMKKKKYK